MNCDEETYRTAAARYVAETMKDLKSATNVKLMAGATTRAFHDALTSFKSEWNARNCPMLYAFPDEIFAMCFSLLPIHDRVAAAVVCRRWRRISTGHSALWSDLSFPLWFFPRHEKLLPTILGLSGTAPVDLYLDLSCEDLLEGDEPDLDSGSYCDFVYECIKEHAHHFRSLNLKNVPPLYLRSGDFEGSIQTSFSMLGLNAPLLETLDVTALYGLPNAPILKSLTTSSVWSPPQSKVFPSVTELNIQTLIGYDVYLDFSQQAFQLFPNLEYFYSADLDALPPQPIPSTLVHLELGSYKPLGGRLISYHGHCESLRMVSLVDPVNLNAGFALFFSMRTSIIELTILYSYIEIEALGFVVRVSGTSVLSYMFNRVPNIASHLLTVEKLHLEILEYIVYLADERLSLPALKETYAHAFHRFDNFRFEENGNRHLDVPQLRTVTIHYQCPQIRCPCDDWNCKVKQPQAHFRDLGYFWNQHLAPMGFAPETLVLSGMPWNIEYLDFTPLQGISRTIQTGKGEVILSSETIRKAGWLYNARQMHLYDE